jgi:two-component system CheB/CheR fusion protein
MEYNKDSSILQFPIVGIGASAGGLEAFKQFLQEIPEESGMAYIFVLHLNAEKVSALAEILSKVSKIPVVEIEDGVPIEMDHAYVIPSHSMLTTEDAKLVLRPRNDNTKMKVIDLFFSSLGIVHESFAVGVILSGALNDGTLGLKVIKASGGITFAQDDSAAFESMPKSAIEAGAVNYILPADLIAKKILEINQPFSVPPNSKSQQEHQLDDKAYKNILGLINKTTGTNFTHYKQNTIKRRIIRRMAFSKIYRPEEYYDFLVKTEEELQLLYKDLMISVTSFFRDPKSFEDLKEVVFPAIIKHKHEHDTFRVWIAGCASGEEAYSVAIGLHEFFGEKLSKLKIQIFATDISEDAIFKARHGIYTKLELDSISPERLTNYFTKLDGSFQIKKFIRDTCVFASHNMLTDPPFSRIDLVTCRNVMIYFDATLQKHVLNTFHYALNEKGFLMLGKSETANAASNLFQLKSKNDKIYIKKGVGTKMHFSNESIKHLYSGLKHTNVPESTSSIFQQSDSVLLSSFAPASVLINEHCDILQFRGNLDTWLTPPSGKATLNLLKMAREGLSFELRSLISEAKRLKNHNYKKSFSIKLKDEIRNVEIEIVKIDATDLYFLIVFKEQRSEQQITKPVEYKATDKDHHIERLENELAVLRDKMKSIAEDQEAVNEELQSANEELRSSNEELQTVNEELETSKEELLSTNEEIAIINSEMRDRNQQLNKLQKFTEAVLNTVREPLLMLTPDLQIRRATEGFYRTFNLTEDEIENKRIFDMDNKNWDIPELRDLLQKALKSNLSLMEIEFTHEFPRVGKKILHVNVRPIEKNGGQQILLAFEDITDKKKVERSMEELRLSNDDLQQFANIASHDMQEPIRKIITFVNLIKNDTFTKKTDPEVHLDKIKASAYRLQNLVKDILNYSTVKNKKELFQKSDLSEILAQTISDFEMIIKEKQAVIKVNELAVVDAIPLQINQLFHNIIGNALKFTDPSKQPEIEISGRKATKSDIAAQTLLNAGTEYFSFSIKDNGIGIEEQYYEKIFLMFQRLEGAAAYPGTGIGLALCRKIVLNHSGEITVSSIPGKGTVFTIYLPFTQSLQL